MKHSDLIDPIVLKSHQLAVGAMFVQGAGYRVGTWDGRFFRHMAPAAARRLARDLAADDAEVAAQMGPVIKALDEVAARVDALDPPAMGHA